MGSNAMRYYNFWWLQYFNLQSFWNALVEAMGQRYDGVSCVHGVDMWAGGAGGPGDGTGIDCFFAPTSADCTARMRSLAVVPIAVMCFGATRAKHCARCIQKHS